MRTPNIYYVTILFSSDDFCILFFRMKTSIPDFLLFEFFFLRLFRAAFFSSRYISSVFFSYVFFCSCIYAQTGSSLPLSSELKHSTLSTELLTEARLSPAGASPTGGEGRGGRDPPLLKTAGFDPPPRNLDISVYFFLKAYNFFAFSNIFKTKWPKSEEKLNFSGRWVWVPIIPTPPPPLQSKIRGDAPAVRGSADGSSHHQRYSCTLPQWQVWHLPVSTENSHRAWFEGRLGLTHGSALCLRLGLSRLGESNWTEPQPVPVPIWSLMKS